LPSSASPQGQCPLHHAGQDLEVLCCCRSPALVRPVVRTPRSPQLFRRPWPAQDRANAESPVAQASCGQDSSPRLQTPRNRCVAGRADICRQNRIRAQDERTLPDCRSGRKQLPTEQSGGLGAHRGLAEKEKRLARRSRTRAHSDPEPGHKRVDARIKGGLEQTLDPAGRARLGALLWPRGGGTLCRWQHNGKRRRILDDTLLPRIVVRCRARCREAGADCEMPQGGWSSAAARGAARQVCGGTAGFREPPRPQFRRRQNNKRSQRTIMRVQTPPKGQGAGEEARRVSQGRRWAAELKQTLVPEVFGYAARTSQQLGAERGRRDGGRCAARLGARATVGERMLAAL